MRLRIGFALVLVSLLVGVGASVQGAATLSGTVLDRAGAPLAGAAVTVTGPQQASTVTDARGVFTFARLLPGAYAVRVESAGFQTAAAAVTLQPGVAGQLRVQLERLSSADKSQISPVGPPPPPPPALQQDASASPKTVAESLAFRRDGLAPTVGISSMPVPAPMPYLPGRYSGPMNTEAYAHLDENPFRRVGSDPLSTFSIDVDTASYANLRRFLTGGTMPPPGAVRIEEMINYFRFAYQQPRGEHPFSVTTELADAPWNSKHRLLLIGLHGREMPADELPARNLVFLIDVSGSMDSPDKLPLVRQAMSMLASTLQPRDRVAIVVYAGASGLVLPSTPGDRKNAIHHAIETLRPGGSTNGAAGITLAYQVAREHFVRGGINRVILATDGDFNVGVTSQDELVRLIERERASGVFLSVLGVGTGNLKDSTMEMLADKGNGNYSYLDTLHEARKVLVREAGGTLITIAKDVKIQVEFNPAAVSAYRLIGYENRVLRNEEFNDDKKDAGEIGAGHSVTALYEIVPAGVESDTPGVDPLKYQRTPERTGAAASGELLNVKLRYKQPDGETSKLLSVAVQDRAQPLSANLGFASAVAEFGMLLRESKHAGSASFAAAIARARQFRGDDPDGYRAEFIKLVELASAMRRVPTTQN